MNKIVRLNPISTIALPRLAVAIQGRSGRHERGDEWNYSWLPNLYGKMRNATLSITPQSSVRPLPWSSRYHFLSRLESRSFHRKLQDDVYHAEHLLLH
jgi:hypothetical protein